jgi:hypothetical protein
MRSGGVKSLIESPAPPQMMEFGMPHRLIPLLFFVCHSSLQEKDGGTIVDVQCHDILIVVRGGGKVIKGAVVVVKSATGH